MDDDEIEDNEINGAGLVISVKAGETINIFTGEIVIHSSWYGWYTRYTGSEDRTKLVTWLNLIVSTELAKILTTEQRGKLRSMTTGLRNLSLTYISDETTTLEINEMIKRIENVLCRFNENYVNMKWWR